METYGRYELLAKLATGGMAQVFLARQSGPEGFEKLVVVKRILSHLAENEEFVRMFLQEAKTAARLNHPGIAQIFDLGKVGDSFFITMEYVHGEDFRRVVKQTNAEGRTLPIPLAVRMVIGACEGLDFAHAKNDEQGRPLGIVHRDVSPQNLLVTFEGQVKVIDFGIAKAADSASNTRTGVLKGKYSYMSPEQAEGQKVNRRSDVFALGIVLYELVTQQRLFRRASDLATIQAVIACVVPRPTEVNPSIDPALEGILLRALEKDREKRTPTAGQLQLELEEYLLSHQQPGSTAQLRATSGGARKIEDTARAYTVDSTRRHTRARLAEVAGDDAERRLVGSCRDRVGSPGHLTGALAAQSGDPCRLSSHAASITGSSPFSLCLDVRPREPLQPAGARPPAAPRPRVRASTRDRLKCLDPRATHWNRGRRTWMSPSSIVS